MAHKTYPWLKLARVVWTVASASSIVAIRPAGCGRVAQSLLEIVSVCTAPGGEAALVCARVCRVYVGLDLWRGQVGDESARLQQRWCGQLVQVSGTSCKVPLPCDPPARHGSGLGIAYAHAHTRVLDGHGGLCRPSTGSQGHSPRTCLRTTGRCSRPGRHVW